MLLLAGADPLLQSPAGIGAKEMTESPPVRELIAAFADSSGSARSRQAALNVLDPELANELLACLGEEKLVPVLSEQVRIEKNAKAVFDERRLAGGDDEEPPLVVAVREGSITQVEQLLQQRADPNALDILGETPLFEASASGSFRLAAVLLLAGADPLRRSPSEQTTACDLASEKP